MKDVKEAPGGPLRIVPPAGKLTALEKMVEDETSDFPAMERHYSVRARLYKSFFQSLLDEDFSRDEALRITECEFIE